MFTFILVIVILLPIAALPSVLTFFSPAELNEMGICLENAGGVQYEKTYPQEEPIIIQMSVACGNP